jgi:hypothetical protein
MAYVETHKIYAGPATEEGEWGVYETECPECGRNLVQVALIEDVEAGYIDIEAERCMSCMNPPHPN